MSALDRQLNTRLNVIYGLIVMNNAIANLVSLALFMIIKFRVIKFTTINFKKYFKA